VVVLLQGDQRRRTIINRVGGFLGRNGKQRITLTFGYVLMQTQSRGSLTLRKKGESFPPGYLKTRLQSLTVQQEKNHTIKKPLRDW